MPTPQETTNDALVALGIRKKPGAIDAMKEKAKSNWAPLVAGGAAAAGTYALSRRIRPGVMGDAAARAARARGIGVVEHGADSFNHSPFMKYLMHGTTKVHGGQNTGRARDVVKGLKDVGVIFDPFTSHKKLLRASGKGQFVQGYSTLKDAKTVEYAYFSKHAPELFAKSQFMKDMKLTGTPVERARQLSAKLKGKNFILKHDDDFQSAGTLVTDRDDLVAMARFGTRDKATKDFIRRANKLENPDPYGFVAHMQSDPQRAATYRLLRMLKDPAKSLVQERHELGKNGILDSVLARLSNSIKHPEYRVHVVNGKVVPGGSRSRFNQGRAVFDSLGAPNRDLSKAEKWLQSQLDLVPAHKLKDKSFGFDVARLQSGKFKAMEANPTGENGASGYLYNMRPQAYADASKQMLTKLAPKDVTDIPYLKEVGKDVVTTMGSAVARHRLISAILGQDTHAIATAKALLAGTATTGTYAGGQQLAK